MDQTGDEQLVCQAQSGSQHVLLALYQQYLSPIYRYAYSKTGTRMAAEDVSAEVFLKMVSALKDFRGESSFKNWLYGITKHAIADYWRDHYRKNQVALEQADERRFATPPRDAENELDLETALQREEAAAQSILRQLPTNYRRVLELRFLKNYTIKETADALQLTVANTKVLQYRALKKASQLVTA